MKKITKWWIRDASVKGLVVGSAKICDSKVTFNLKKKEAPSKMNK